MTPNFHSPNQSETSKSASPYNCATPQLIAGDGEISLNKSGIVYDEFAQLVKMMSKEEYKNIFCKYIKLEEFTCKILDIIEKCNEFVEIDSELVSLIESCFEILIPCLLYQPDLIEILYKKTQAQKVHFLSILMIKLIFLPFFIWNNFFIIKF